ncbi:MAG: hypothetical protein K0R98_1740 [Rickettsiaceae bacterium]|jgi:hypothetical protein|nr:hypothetical protein [Rickettsiaceae bacterium]
MSKDFRDRTLVIQIGRSQVAPELLAKNKCDTLKLFENKISNAHLSVPDLDDLINSIKRSKNKNILVVCERDLIPNTSHMIHLLLKNDCSNKRILFTSENEIGLNSLLAQGALETKLPNYGVRIVENDKILCPELVLRKKENKLSTKPFTERIEVPKSWAKL